jgi:hypothetical protein
MSCQDASELSSEMIGDHKFAIQYGGSRLSFDSHLPGGTKVTSPVFVKKSEASIYGSS